MGGLGTDHVNSRPMRGLKKADGQRKNLKFSLFQEVIQDLMTELTYN